MAMPCGKDGCGTNGGGVKDSRPTGFFGGATRRRRHCSHCGHRWTTYEVEATSLEALHELEQRLSCATTAFRNISQLADSQLNGTRASVSTGQRD